MSDAWVLGLIVRADASVREAWRARKTRSSSVRGLPAALATAKGDVSIATLLDELADAVTVEEARTGVRGVRLTVTALLEGPAQARAAQLVGAVAMLATLGARGLGALAAVDGSMAFRLVLGDAPSIERVPSSALPTLLESAPMRAVSRMLEARDRAGARARRTKAREAERANAARREAVATLRAGHGDALLDAIERARGPARREAVVAALRSVAHDLGLPERRKRVRADPRWVELALLELDEPSAICQAAIAILAASGDRRVVGPLAASIPRHRGLLVEICDALTKLGDPSALPALEEAMAAETLPWMRDLVSAAIVRLRRVSSEASPRLVGRGLSSRAAPRSTPRAARGDDRCAGTRGGAARARRRRPR